MPNVNDAVIDQRKIYIIDWNIVVFDICIYNSGDFFLQGQICSFLQFRVNTQIKVISRYGICFADDLGHTPKIININLLFAVLSAEIRFIELFNTGFSNNIIFCIAFVDYRQFLILGIGNLTGIADDGRKVFTVIIAPYRILIDRDSYQRIHMLVDVCNGPVTDIFRNGRGIVTGIIICIHHIAHNHDLIGQLW